MSPIEFITTEDYKNSVEVFKSNSLQDKLDGINDKLKDLPKVLDPLILQKLKDGEYEITLKEYNDLSSYRTVMSALYGNSSASKLPEYLKKISRIEDDRKISAKDFIDKMQEKGLEKKAALKLYTAMKSYSVMNSYLLNNNGYVSAKI